MLNLPNVTGWGTDTIAKTMISKSAEQREKETERTRMIGNALLQQAKEGNLDEAGYNILSQKFPELAGTAKQANEQAKAENTQKLQNMKLQKTETGWKLFNQKIDAAQKFGDETVYGEAGRELQKAAYAEAKQFADMMGIPFNMSAAMDAQDIKKEQKKFNMLLLQENIKGIQQGATPEQIASVEGMLAVFASKNKDEPAIPIMEKMIATAKSRLEKEAEKPASYKEFQVSQNDPEYRKFLEGKKNTGAESINQFATFYRGFSAEHPELKGGELDSAATKAWSDMRLKEARESSKARGEGFAASRAVNMIDTKNNNAPLTISVKDAIDANKAEPGRYVPITGGEKALNKLALMEDIRGTAENVKASLENPDLPEFTAAQRAQIALVMKQRDLTSAVSQFMAGTWGQTLTPEQQDYIIDLAQLKENAMAMRSVLGAGQGSDELRAAITATIPGPGTPNKQYALKQLEKFVQVLNRLERGVLNVPLRPKEKGKDYGSEQGSGAKPKTADDYLKKFK